MRRSAALIYELSRPGRLALDLPQPDVPVQNVETLIPGSFLRSEPAALPEVS